MVARLLALDTPSVHVLVVDDNSPDGTGQLADQLAATSGGRVAVVHRTGKLGLGSAYITGFRRALDDGADFIFEMDADFQHPPEDVVRLFAAVQNADIAVGSRYVEGGSVDPGWNLFRKLLSAGGNAYARAILGLRVRDTTAGFKCFRASALQALPMDRIRSDGYAFQIEMTYAAQRAGLRTVEVPILFLERKQGTSKMSPNIAAEAAWRVWEIRRRY
jgi:dolichol-phosphate mannosyltransferase